MQVSPDMRSFLHEKWSPENSRELMQIVEDELSLHNFRDILRSFQGAWAPLSVEYARWKALHYPGAEKWVMTGSFLDSLTTPAKLTVSGGSYKNKYINLDTSRRGVISATYEFRAPSAGGYFEKNNRRRPIWFLLPKHREKIIERITKTLRLKMRKAGFR